jgi:hypothetical protein
MRYCRIVLLSAALLCTSFLPAAAADSLEGTVLVADDAFSIEDVLEEVLVKRRPDRVTKFWIVITGDQVKLATKANGMRDRPLVRAFDLVRQYGGIFYACETDMARQGLAAGDLLPPTEPLKGFDADAPLTADQRFYVGEDPAWLPDSETQLRRLRAACSARS